MKQGIAMICLLLAAAGCTLATKDNAGASAGSGTRGANQENASMNTDKGKADQPPPPPEKIQPSPWQPPAEIDPVPPPVEGGETRDDNDGPGGA